MVLIPVGFVGGMLLGEALVSAQGFEVGSDEFPPLGVALLAGLPALVIVMAPAVLAIVMAPAVLAIVMAPAALAIVMAPAALAIVLGLRARRHGASTGWIPALIGALVAAYAVLANSLPLVLGVWAS